MLDIVEFLAKLILILVLSGIALVIAGCIITGLAMACRSIFPEQKRRY